MKIEDTIKRFQNSQKLAFRGQAKICYSLQTRLADKYKNNHEVTKRGDEIINSFRNKILKNNLEKEIYLDDFQFPKPNYKNEWLWLFQAQHVRIPTIIMDWSFDWKVSLFFAVFDDKNMNKSGQLWCLDTAELTHNHGSLDEHSVYMHKSHLYNKYSIIRPAAETNWLDYLPQRRIYYQQGGFLILPASDYITPLEEREEFKEKLFLLEITPGCKKEIFDLYNEERELPEIYNELNGVYQSMNKYYRKYDNNFFYGKISDKLLSVVNEVRSEFLFDNK
ncbi:MAG: FRG domain-containing protein [Ignavibacteriaceae bacterium]